MPFDKKKKRQLRPLWIHRKMHARRLSKKTYSQFLLLVKRNKEKAEGTHQNFCKSNITLNPKSGKDRTKTKDKNKNLYNNSPDEHKCKFFNKTSVNQIQAKIF